MESHRTTAQQLFDLYEDGVVVQASRIFNTYGGKSMSMTDRLEAVIDAARHDGWHYSRNRAEQMTNEQYAAVLSLLDEVCTNPVISGFDDAEQVEA